MLSFDIKYELFFNETITKFVYYLIIHLTLNSYHKSEIVKCFLYWYRVYVVDRIDWMSKLYHVVTFVNENDSAEAVPTIWVNCGVFKWPDDDADRLRRAIKSHEERDDDWPEYDVKILYKSGRCKQNKKCTLLSITFFGFITCLM